MTDALDTIKPPNDILGKITTSKVIEMNRMRGKHIELQATILFFVTFFSLFNTL